MSAAAYHIGRRLRLELLQPLPDRAPPPALRLHLQQCAQQLRATPRCVRARTRSGPTLFLSEPPCVSAWGTGNLRGAQVRRAHKCKRWPDALTAQATCEATTRRSDPAASRWRTSTGPAHPAALRAKQSRIIIISRTRPERPARRLLETPPRPQRPLPRPPCVRVAVLSACGSRRPNPACRCAHAPRRHPTHRLAGREGAATSAAGSAAAGTTHFCDGATGVSPTYGHPRPRPRTHDLRDRVVRGQSGVLQTEPCHRALRRPLASAPRARAPPRTCTNTWRVS